MFSVSLSSPHAMYTRSLLLYNLMPMAAKKKQSSNPTVELYEKLMATLPEIERKGDANPYTALNGNMFTLLHQSQTLAIRLPAEEREVPEEVQHDPI